MSHLAILSAPDSTTKIAGVAAAWIVATAGKLRAGAARRRAIHQLSQLDDRALKDIGLYRTDLVAFGSHYRPRRPCD